ncbi:MAG: hypothetical protein M0Q23_01440 [Syntrophales bacterium]|jgi:hypothetical protein|nr:hypothetical protein [Syntrophales bacterium]MCK9527311.1 hypothetical protein [Syntrophales bacterium]MDX9921219.1 hypothetical protein [Syntrophales bacterium]
MKKPAIFQIRSKKDARLLAGEIRRSDREFYYYVPLLGGMDGGFISIRCNHHSTLCEVYSSAPGCGNMESRHNAELVEHLWKERKYINSELRKTESEWFGFFAEKR